MKKIPYTLRKKYIKDTCFMYDKLKKDKNSSLRRNFRHALDTLDRNEYMIIQNDFINKSEDRTWYSVYWSKNKYYKLKRRMTENFLNSLFI